MFVGEGDCDYDSECMAGLKCGTDNCLAISLFLGNDRSNYDSTWVFFSISFFNLFFQSVNFCFA